MRKIAVFLFLLAVRLPTVESFVNRSSTTLSLFPRHNRPSVAPSTRLSTISHDLSSSSNNEHSNGPEPFLFVRKVVFFSWMVAIASFLAVNYASPTPWPALLSEPSFPVWRLVHDVSGMLFCGSIITTTILEWMVVRSKVPSVLEYWFSRVEDVQNAVVLPALTGLIVSGVAQSFLLFGSGVQYAPFHVKLALHVLTLFGVWWGLTDMTTQSVAAREVVGDTIPRVVYWRRWSNVVSCLFCLALYGIMVLKPQGITM